MDDSSHRTNEPLSDECNRPNLSIDTYVPTLVARLALRLLKSSQEPFEEHNLTIPKFRILMTVSEFPGIKFKRLRELTRIKAATLSRVLDTLEAEGHIRRRRAKSDSRSVNIELTLQGEQLFKASMPWAMETEERLLSGLTAKQKKSLVKLLNHMHRNLDAQDGLTGDESP